MHYIERYGITASGEPGEIYHARDLGIEVQLLGLDINIARQYIVEYDVLDEIGLVVFFIVQGFYARERYCEHSDNALRLIVGALDEHYVFNARVRADRTVGISVECHHIEGI